MTDNKELFAHMDETCKTNIKLGNKKSLELAAKDVMEIHDIYYTPNLNHALLSVGQLCEKNYRVVFDDKQCIIYDCVDAARAKERCDFVGTVEE